MTGNPEIEKFAVRNNPRPPARLGQRYTSDQFLTEAGNTVVCHLDRTDPAHHAVLQARAAMQDLPGAETLLFTPESSLHMTVFEGAIDTRRTEDAWPKGMDKAMPMDQVTKALLPRFQSFGPLPEFKVQAVGIRPGGLQLDGARVEDKKAMQDWRNALTQPFGYRHKNHDSYRFHMTFAYSIAWLPDDLISLWQDATQRILAELVAAAPIIPLQSPAFCAFTDMTHFEPLCVFESK